MVVLERYTVPVAGGGIKHMRYVSRVDWRNISLFLHWRVVRQVGICTPWGNLILGDWLPFSYRINNKTAFLRLGKWTLRWVRLKAVEPDAP